MPDNELAQFMHMLITALLVVGCAAGTGYAIALIIRFIRDSADRRLEHEERRQRMSAQKKPEIDDYHV